MDLQVCLDYFAVITYITEYYSKDDTHTMKFLMDSLKGSEAETLKEKMFVVMNTFITVRQMGEAEAYYRILPELHLKESNSTAIFVPSCRKKDRSKFLKAVQGDEIHHNQVVVEVEEREGLYVESYDMVDKWYRRPNHLEDLSFSHFAKMFRAAWKVAEEIDEVESGTDNEIQTDNEGDNFVTEQNKFHFIMTSRVDEKPKRLPPYFKLTSVNPGEPPFMRKRSFPAVLRFHKYKDENKQHSFYFSELLLYYPHFDEMEIFPEDETACTKLYFAKQQEISLVKSQVMEHLQGVEEARYFVEKSLAENKSVGDDLDAAGEQEEDDCDYEGLVEHPDFLHLDPDVLPKSEDVIRVQKCYRQIEVDELSILCEKTRQLDSNQRKVVDIALTYAKDMVKCLYRNTKMSKPPAVLVPGGAGSGKSATINILKQWVHLTLQNAGDDPNMPYILVTAPTGAAACNVKGQTLHTAFSFHFGNNYLSLSDKLRDVKRCQLQHLKFVIVDEKSMVKADMLYQLDRRLREITQKTDEFMGGVALFCFGDILQLRPCKGRFMFDRPKCQDFQLAFECDPLWEKFDVIFLEKNHRQESDHEYADILNRIRIGEPSEHDIKKLMDRVRPKNHPDLKGAMVITCTNEAVNTENRKCLNKVNGELIEVEAINIHPTIKNFKPAISKKGTVKETPFLSVLQLKCSAKIMLTYNIDTLDGLTNGARGTLIDVFKKVMFQYSLAKKTSIVSNCAKVVQFPVVLCFAATAHKFQGQTILKPSKLVVDLRTVFEAAQGYVMLSRIQSLDQLYILEDLPVNKLYASKKALDENEKMKKRSMNSNPTPWFNHEPSSFKIASLNCRSLNKHFDDVRNDPMVLEADVICLSETWLSHLENGHQFKIDGYNVHLNSVGSGKGLAIYFKGKESVAEVLVNDDKLQISKVTCPQIDVIAVYRTSQGSQERLVEAVRSSTNQTKPTLVVGDFNLCAVADNNSIVSKTLRQLGFSQIVTRATHIKGETFTDIVS